MYTYGFKVKCGMVFYDLFLFKFFLAIGVGLFGCNCGGLSIGLFGNTGEDSQQSIGK